MSDKRFKRKKAKSAEDLRRKAAKRAPYECVLIVCEDSKSVPNYLRAVISHYKLNSANVEIVGDECGSAPLTVVNHAIQKVGNRNKQAKRTGEPVYDRVFCVIDRDNHPDIHAAIDKASQQKPPIDIIISVPSFELWLLLHFTYRSAPFSASGNKSIGDAVVLELLKHMPSYKKSGVTMSDMSSLLSRMNGTAIPNAIAIRNEQKKISPEDKFPNPITYMDELIVYLRELKK